MRKLDREQIEALLTTQQLTMLRKLSVPHKFFDVLLSSAFFESFPAGKEPPGILDRINASKEQKDELRRLHEEQERMMRQSYRESGETALKVLSPEQQEKLVEALDSLVR